MREIENIEYFENIKVGNLTYSIDMLHIEFTSNLGNKNDNNNSTKSIMKYILMKLKFCNVDIGKLKSGEVGTYIENIEPNLAKRKYYSYRSLISYNGVSILIGKFFKKIGVDNDEHSSVYDCENCVRLIYNPNKHHNSPFLQSLIPYLSNNFTGRIIKYDLAIDVPDVVPNFIDVFTKKHKATCVDTQYYGARSRHGYIKIYNKSKELKLKDKQITRIEFTLKTGQPLPTDEILIPLNTSAENLNLKNLSKQCTNYILMINELKLIGGDWKRHFDNIDSRTRKKIEPFVVGSNKKLVLSDNDVVQLLSCYSNIFNITQRFDIVNNTIDYDFDDELGF